MKLLYIDCCITVHGSASRTAALAETFLSAWRAAHPEADIETLDLKTLTLNPLLGNALRLRETLQGEGRTEGASFALARQFAAADRIVIAAPYWELSFPAQLRLYIEHIAAQGITFDYTSQDQVGLCRAEKLLFLTTAGGSLEANCGSEHWRALCPFFGIGEYNFIGAPMQDVKEIDHEALLRDALAQAKALAESF